MPQAGPGHRKAGGGANILSVDTAARVAPGGEHQQTVPGVAEPRPGGQQAGDLVVGAQRGERFGRRQRYGAGDVAPALATSPTISARRTRSPSCRRPADGSGPRARAIRMRSPPPPCAARPGRPSSPGATRTTRRAQQQAGAEAGSRNGVSPPPPGGRLPDGTRGEVPELVAGDHAATAFRPLRDGPRACPSTPTRGST